MELGLKGRTAVIVGGSTGIGKAACHRWQWTHYQYCWFIGDDGMGKGYDAWHQQLGYDARLDLPGSRSGH